MQTVRTNLTNNASTQYTNYPFTSMTLFNGVILGAGTSGLFKIDCGMYDDTANIDASFKTGDSVLGYHGNKRLGHIYLGVETAGEITVTPVFDGVDMPVVTFTPPLPLVRQNIMAKVGRGEKGVYMAFEVANVDGAQFSLDAMHTTTTNLNR